MFLLFVLMTLAAPSASRPESPIACNLNALTQAERAQYAQLAERLARGVRRVEAVANGYKLHLTDAISTDDLLKFVQFEQRCCPFLDFEIGLARENGARWVQMTGRKGVKEFLASEFKLKPGR